MNIKKIITKIKLLSTFDSKTKKIISNTLNSNNSQHIPTINRLYSTTHKKTYINPPIKRFITFIKTFLNRTSFLSNNPQKEYSLTLKIIKIHHKSTINNNYKIIIKFGHFETVIIYLPKKLTIKAHTTQNGHLLHITTTNKQTTTNLAAIIKNLKKPNIYTGRGIYNINTNIKLKTYKK